MANFLIQMRPSFLALLGALACFFALLCVHTASGQSLIVEWGNRNYSGASEGGATRLLPTLLTTTFSGDPVPSNWTSVAYRRDLTVALDDTGQLWVWGMWGEERIRPRKVDSSLHPPERLRSVSAASFVFFGLSYDSKRLYSWSWSASMPFGLERMLGRDVQTLQELYLDGQYDNYENLVRKPGLVDFHSGLTVLPEYQEPISDSPDAPSTSPVAPSPMTYPDDEIITFSCSDVVCAALTRAQYVWTWKIVPSRTSANAVHTATWVQSCSYTPSIEYDHPVLMDLSSLSTTSDPITTLTVGSKFVVLATTLGKVYASGSSENDPTPYELGISSYSTDPWTCLSQLDTSDQVLWLAQAPKSLSAGNLHVVYLDASDRIWTWGQNTLYQLTVRYNDDFPGQTAGTELPYMVSFGSSNPTFKEVSATSYGTMALTTDGEVWAWGWGGRVLLSMLGEAGFGLFGTYSSEASSKFSNSLEYGNDGIYANANELDATNDPLGFASSSILRPVLLDFTRLLNVRAISLPQYKLAHMDLEFQYEKSDSLYGKGVMQMLVTKNTSPSAPSHPSGPSSPTTSSSPPSSPNTTPSRPVNSPATRSRLAIFGSSIAPFSPYNSQLFASTVYSGKILRGNASASEPDPIDSTGIFQADLPYDEIASIRSVSTQFGGIRVLAEMRDRSGAGSPGPKMRLFGWGSLAFDVQGAWGNAGFNSPSFQRETATTTTAPQMTSSSYPIDMTPWLNHTDVQNISSIAFSPSSTVVLFSDGSLYSYYSVLTTFSVPYAVRIAAGGEGIVSRSATATRILCGNPHCFLLNTVTHRLYAWRDGLPSSPQPSPSEFVGRSPSDQTTGRTCDYVLPVSITAANYIDTPPAGNDLQNVYDMVIGDTFSVIVMKGMNKNQALFSWYGKQSPSTGTYPYQVLGQSSSVVSHDELWLARPVDLSHESLNGLNASYAKLLSISAGKAHTLVLYEGPQKNQERNRYLISWGSNQYGQLGYSRDRLYDYLSSHDANETSIVSRQPERIPLSSFSADSITLESVACVRHTSFVYTSQGVFAFGLGGPGGMMGSEVSIFSTLGLTEAIKLSQTFASTSIVSSPTAYSVAMIVGSTETLDSFTSEKSRVLRAASSTQAAFAFGIENQPGHPFSTMQPGDVAVASPLVHGAINPSEEKIVLYASTSGARYYATDKGNIYMSGDVRMLPFISEMIATDASEGPQLISRPMFLASFTRMGVSAVSNLETFGEGLVVHLTNKTVVYWLAASKNLNDTFQLHVGSTDPTSTAEPRVVQLTSGDLLASHVSCDYWTCCFQSSVDYTVSCFGSLEDPATTLEYITNRVYFPNSRPLLDKVPSLSWSTTGSYSSLSTMSVRKGVVATYVTGDVYFIPFSNPTGGTVKITGVIAETQRASQFSAGYAHLSALVVDVSSTAIGIAVSGFDASIVSGLGDQFQVSLSSSLGPFTYFRQDLFNDQTLQSAVSHVYSLIILTKSGEVWTAGLSFGDFDTKPTPGAGWVPPPVNVAGNLQGMGPLRKRMGEEAMQSVEEAFTLNPLIAPSFDLTPSRVPIPPGYTVKSIFGQRTWSNSPVGASAGFSLVPPRTFIAMCSYKDPNAPPSTPGSAPSITPGSTVCKGNPPVPGICVCDPAAKAWRCYGLVQISSGTVIKYPVIIEGGLIVPSNAQAIISLGDIFGNSISNGYNKPAVISVTGCATVSSSLVVELSNDKLVKSIPAKGSKPIVLLETGCPLYNIKPITLKQTAKKCRQIAVTQRQQTTPSGKAQLSAIFSVKKDTCNTWWIVLVSVIAAVLVLSVVVLVLFLTVPAVKSAMTPYRGTNA